MGFWLADMQFMAGSKGAQEITFNLRGDYIVAVEQAARSTGGGQLMPGTLLICQGAVGHSSSLGVQVIFFTVPALESLEVTTRDTRHVGHAMPRQGQR